VDRQGRTRGVVRVGSARAGDWEDLAYGPGPDGNGHFLYIGDIGDNRRARTDPAVYRITEPRIGDVAGTRKNPLPGEGPTVRRTFRYPDGRHDAEALLVHPRTGIVYIVTKDGGRGVAGVYKFPPENINGRRARRDTLVKVATLTLPSELWGAQVTAGDIAPDGRRAVLRTYGGAYEWMLPAGAADFDAIWKTRPSPIRMPMMPQGEAICYNAAGDSLFATSEQAPTPLYELKRKR
jgi:hypothetical protein